MAVTLHMSGSGSGDTLYATINLARLVQKVKDRLKCRIEKCVISAKPRKTTPSTRFTTYVWKTASSTIKFLPISGCYVSQRRTLSQGQRWNTDVCSLLDALDHHVSSRDLSLRTVAAHDSLFVRHDFQIAGTVKSIDEYHNVLNLTTALLGRLQNLSGSNSVSVGTRFSDFECGKFAANLAHLLRCLKQIALNAVICHSIDLVKAHILHWHKYWQNQKRICEGWFAEWPNGQRPLSTTWPWNVKLSILVLWGVCWMFYGPFGQLSRDEEQLRATRNQWGAVQGAELGGDIGTREVGSQSQPSPQAPGPSDAWATPAVNTFPNYSWLHPQQAGVLPRRANDPILGTVLPTYPTSNPYITATSTESTEIFATSSIQWPYSQGINQAPPPAYAPDYAWWQPAYNATDNITETLTATPQGTDPQTPVHPYAPQRQANSNTQAAVGRSLGFGPGLYLQGMQDYPSPHSNVSEQTKSPCFPALSGAMMSPRMPVVTSPATSVIPSVGGSTISGQSSRRSTEPPRNAQGVLFCADPECAQKPPVFSRKCEWTKHMDKHTRPYVCEEPECENIRGFTYSGGLLRHQREVHRQHGGPKASSMCPHKDCKRSTGVGFSRKENLNEHLRRCHHPQHLDTDSNRDKTADDSSRSRKRRRAADDNEDGEEKEENDDLQREVKKLRKEVAEKEERIKNLEKWMENLTRSHGTLK